MQNHNIIRVIYNDHLKRDIEYKVFNKNIQIFEENYFHIGAYLNNNLVGTIKCHQIFENIDILDVNVKEDYRRKGIGSELLESLIFYCNYNKVKTITLEVSIKNEYALTLYNKKGFNKIRTIKNYYKSEDAFMMQKEVLYE